MSIMDIIRGFNQGTPQANGPQTVPPNSNGSPGPQPGNATVTNTQVIEGTQNSNPTIPGSDLKTSDGSHPAFPAVEDGKSPLDSYADLWQPLKDAKPAPSIMPTFTMDPAKIREVAGKVDFTREIKPEDMANALKGDAAAFANVINQAAQAGFAHSTMATGTIVRDALKQQAETFYKDVMPDMFKRNAISNSVNETNPAFSNPAMAPIVKAVEQQVIAKYPQASPAEITKHAQTILAGMSEAVITGSGRQVVDPKSQTDQSSRFAGFNQAPTDWEKWMET